MDTITITPNGYRVIDATRQVTFFTFTYQGQAYRWHGNTPILTGPDLQAYLDAHAVEYVGGIYRKMYVEALITPELGETDLAAWERWIAGGCKNTREIISQIDGETVTETIEEVIPLTLWKDTHPVHTDLLSWL